MFSSPALAVFGFLSLAAGRLCFELAAAFTPEERFPRDRPKLPTRPTGTKRGGSRANQLLRSRLARCAIVREHLFTGSQPGTRCFPAPATGKAAGNSNGILAVRVAVRPYTCAEPEAELDLVLSGLRAAIHNVFDRPEELTDDTLEGLRRVFLAGVSCAALSSFTDSPGALAAIGDALRTRAKPEELAQLRKRPLSAGDPQP